MVSVSYDMAAPRDPPRCAVLGAGPMGLVAALDLLDHGFAVDLYERDGRIGGMSATFDFDGVEIERYYHFICRPDRPMFDLLKRLHLYDKLRWVDTKMGFYYDGKLYDWGTPRALMAFDRLDILSKIRYGLHALRARSFTDWRRLDRISATRWVRRWVGERGYEVLWKSLFDLKLHEFAEQTSAAWIATRIRRVALSRRSASQESLGYIEGGSAVLLQRLEAAILARGGRIHLSAPVERVITAAGRAVGVSVEGRVHACDSVISTIPLPYVPSLIPDCPESFLERLRAVRNIPVACVILKLDRPLTDKFWMNINDPRIPIPGIIEYSNLNPVGATILYAPFYMPKTHPKWRTSNDELVAEVIESLRLINPSFHPEQVLAAHCHRYEFAQTICPPGFFDTLPPIETPIEGFFAADTGSYYPEDRSISESTALAHRLARLAACRIGLVKQ